MGKRIKERKKHEKIAIGLAGLGTACLIISAFPGGHEACTGILQGIGTGLFTGVAILFIGGTKTYEINEKNEAIDFLHKYKEEIEAIDKIEINIGNKKVIINGMNYSIAMINYIPLQIKLFVEKYSDDIKFNKIISDSMLEFQKSLKENYYKEAIDLCNEGNKSFNNHDEFLRYVHKIAALHNNFCEEVFEADVDIMINKSILKYNEEVSELNHSRI